MLLHDREDCDGSGIRPDSTNHAMTKPPIGFVVIERCDTCERYDSDLVAAERYGTDARWWANGTQAIARAD